MTCQNHAPHFLYFCAHCKKVTDTEYTVCSCPKRNTRETCAQAQKRRNREAQENPIILLDDSSSDENEGAGNDTETNSAVQTIQDVNVVGDSNEAETGVAENSSYQTNKEVKTKSSDENEETRTATETNSAVQTVHGGDISAGSRHEVETGIEENSMNQTNKEVKTELECEFCHEKFADEHKLYNSFDLKNGCHGGCEKICCEECGACTCCDGNCASGSFYCKDCQKIFNFQCPCNPDWDLCESCVDDYHEGRPQCTSIMHELENCRSYVCHQCEDDKDGTHWKRCSQCNSFMCLACFEKESNGYCWCGKSWYCQKCADRGEFESCDVGCSAWMCGKGKCKAKMNRDEEISCPDCRRIR